MPTTREVRYISPNDIGKMVTYTNPQCPEAQLGGILEQFRTDAKWYVSQGLFGIHERERGLGSVILTLSGHDVRLMENESVTLYGKDQS